MKSGTDPKTNPNTTTAVLHVFGGLLLALGLIFALAWLFNRADAQAFAEGYRVEGTVVQIWEGDSPGMAIEFVDRNGRSQTWALENISQSRRDSLAIGDSVVALQMQDSPSRLMLLEDAENRPGDWAGLVIATLFILPGTFLLMQKRPFGTDAQQQQMATRQKHLAGGSIFLFVGVIMLVGFVAMLLETEMHVVGRFLFGSFCLLTGGAMAGGGLVQIWKSFRQWFLF